MLRLSIMKVLTSYSIVFACLANYCRTEAGEAWRHSV